MSSPRSRGSPADLSDRVRRRLLVLAEADGADITERRWAFREAAALLTAFDPATLEAGDPHEAGGALLELIDDCVTVGGPTRRLWSLKREVRDAALRRLSGPEQALRSLEANGDPEARPVERMVRAYLRGAAPALEDQDMEQLSHSLQALRWLTQMGGLEGLPAVEDAMQAYARKQLFGPLESLVGGRFHGRRAELSELRLHVGVLDLTTVSTRVRDARRRMSPFNTVTEPPLMVHGPPGIGKSTLLAKVVLDHARAGDRRIPFVYIDFERPTLSVLEPATLLAEAARQLAVQYPEAAAAFGEIADAASQEAPRQRDAAEAIAELDEAPAARVTVSRELAQAARAEARASDDGLIKQLVAVVRDDVFGGSEEPPLLMVLDSFEQAQYRSSPHLRRLWDLFDAFQRWYPRLRVVVSGRAPVEELVMDRRPAKRLKLEELDHSASVAFLMDEGVGDERLAELIAARFGGNPLSLKLAAKLARRGETIAWADDVPTRRWLLFRVEDAQIQSRLYGRLLASISDPDIAALAHPGLVLRRITPAIIQEVMAEPSGVDVPDRRRAEQLFETFARQVDLVERDGEALVHRPDLRRDMLALVEQDKPRTVEALERAAVRHYATRDGPQARAEEIYHRLRLGEEPRDVDRLWEEGVERHLWGAEGEVPARAHAYLAARLLDARATTEALAHADDEDWETLVAREVDDLLDRGGDAPERERNARAALALMATRAERAPAGPLYRLEAEALEMLGDRQSAARVVGAGLAAFEGERMPATAAASAARLELLLLGARVSSGVTADRQLEEAERLAERLEQRIDVLATLLLRVRLHRTGDVGPDDAVRRRAAQRFLALGDDEARRYPTLVRSAAAELGGQRADVLHRAIELLGVHATTPAELDRLERDALDCAAADPSFATWLDAIASRCGIGPGAPGPRVRALLEQLDTTGRLGELAKALVAASADGGAVRTHVIELMEASR